MVEAGGVARLSLAPRAVHCGVPQGAQYIREWGRPARAMAIAARRRASGLPCVALFFTIRSAPFAGSTPHGLHQAQKSRPSEIQRSAFATAWWTRSQRIRTEGEVPFEVAIMDVPEEPLYQQIAEKVLYLHRLGLNNLRIGRHLDVDDKTVAKSLRWRGTRER